MTDASRGRDRSAAAFPRRSSFSILERFSNDARVTISATSLDEALARASRAMGFDFYALVEHGSLTDPLRPVMTNYPAGWRWKFENGRLDRIDPVQQACARRVSGFCWTELKDIISLTPAQERLLEASVLHGIGHGFTVPFHLPGAREASCSFAMMPDLPLPASLPEAQLVALAAYERLLALSDIIHVRRISLSPRQRACVALIAAGLTDREVGRELELSEETVTKYLNAARRRNGFGRRAQLVTAALRDGLIGYEVLDPDSLGYIENSQPLL